MKLISLAIVVSFATLVQSTMGAQSLEIESTDVNNRIMMVLKYPISSTTSSNSIQLRSGFTNETVAELSTWHTSYQPGSGYGGYIGLTSIGNGIIMRSTSTLGDLKFMTGGGSLLNNTRMTITSTGSIGIGTPIPASKLQLESGDIYVKEIGSGVITKSPNGGCWRMTVDNSGSPTFSSIICPN